MSLSILTRRTPIVPLPGGTVDVGRLTLGDPIKGAPLCDTCGRPGQVELNGRGLVTYCVPCIEERLDAYDDALAELADSRAAIRELERALIDRGDA